MGYCSLDVGIIVSSNGTARMDHDREQLIHIGTLEIGGGKRRREEEGGGERREKVYVHIQTNAHLTWFLTIHTNMLCIASQSAIDTLLAPLPATLPAPLPATPSLTQRDLTNTHWYLLQQLCYSFSVCCGARLSGILSLLSFLSLVFLRQLIM